MPVPIVDVCSFYYILCLVCTNLLSQNGLGTGIISKEASGIFGVWVYVLCSNR